MRKRSALLLFLFAAAPLATFAARPTIIIDRDPPNPTIIVNNDFTFGADNLGGGDLSFQNESGQNWRELSISVSLPSLEAITCGPGPFNTCTISQTPQDGSVLYNIIFGPATTGTAITNGELFSIDLNDQGTDPNGAGSWGAGNDFSARANAYAPEPAASALIAARNASPGGRIRLPATSFGRMSKLFSQGCKGGQLP